MHIVIVINTLNRGGAGRHACELASYFAQQYHRVSLIPVNGITDQDNFEIDKRVEIRHLEGALESGRAQGVVDRMLNFFRMRRLMKHLHADVSFALLPYGILLSLFGSFGTPTPVIACERSYPPTRISSEKNPIRRLALHLFYRVFVNGADVIAAQTETTAEWFRAISSNTPVVSIPNAISQSILEFDKPHLCSEQNLILFVGRLIPQKRVHLLISAFLEVRRFNQDWQLVLIGDGPEAEKLAAMVPESLYKNIRFLGHQTDIAHWYSCAEIFVLPSEMEGFPNVLLEAMALESACIAFDIATGPKEILKDSKAGILLPDNSQQERLVNALRELIENSEKREALKNRALYVREAFCRNSILQVWLCLAEKIVCKAERL